MKIAAKRSPQASAELFGKLPCLPKACGVNASPVQLGLPLTWELSVRVTPPAFRTVGVSREVTGPGNRSRYTPSPENLKTGIAIR
jgi:hypothetical protein